MLMLLRHAKSDWSKPEPDIARPLNARGRRDAPRMARHLAGLAPRPEIVLCSPATRTRETLELMRGHWALPEPAHLDALYETGPETLRKVLRPFAHRPVLVVGHNPGLQDLARRIVSSPDPRLDHVPTCTFMAIDTRRGVLSTLVRPKDLPELRS